MHLQHIWLGKNPSHVGRLHEILGFYIVAGPDTSGVGVGDLRDALDDIADHAEWVSDLEKVDIGERAAQEKVNSWITSKHLRKVLAVRVVIFQLFLQLAIHVDGTLQEKHKRIWLFFQLSDGMVPFSRDLHPFVWIMRCLLHASNEALDALIYRLDDIGREYLPHSVHFGAGRSTAGLQIVSPFFHIIYQPRQGPVNHP